MVQLCRIQQCSNPVHSNGLCNSCYMKMYRRKSKDTKTVEALGGLIRMAFGLKKPLEKQYIYVNNKKEINVEYYRNKYNIEV